MAQSNVDRRSFLRGMGSVPLIGTALAAQSSQPKKVAALKGSAKFAIIPTHEWAGNLDERLDFPADWNLNVMHMKGYGAPILTPQQIADAIQKPIGTPPLRELAASKTTVAITFDDLTRATPTFAIAPHILKELALAGIKDENILFLGSFATHRPMTKEEIQKKLGKEISTKYAWLNHSCFYGCKEIGTTSFKTNVSVNQTFLGADLKITLSGVKVHYDAGYGGGAKAVLPGLSYIETVEHNHNVLLRQTRTAGPVRIFKNEMRLDIIEAARMAKVDFSVQTIYDHKLRPTHVFAGDIVDAHHAAVRVAAQTYCTPTFKDADIAITNAYPQCAEAYHGARWINLSVRDGGTGVLIIQHPIGLDPIHFLNNRSASRSGISYFETTARRVGGGAAPVGPGGPGGRGGPGGPVGRGGPGGPGGGRGGPRSGLIVYSQYMDKTLMNNYGAGTQFATKWEQVIQFLKERHKGSSVQVALYPYGGFQHQEIELDG